MNHPNRSKTCRPREILRAVTALYPDAWKHYDKARADRGTTLPNWPEWCYCPMAMAYAIVSGGAREEHIPENPIHISILAALAAWRMGQTIYRFDQDLAENLVKTKIHRLPTEILYRLPQWGVYIETGGLKLTGDIATTPGFFAHLEWDANTGHPELRLLIDNGGPNLLDLLPIPIHINHTNLEAAIQATIDEARRNLIYHGQSMLTGQLDAADPETVARYAAPYISMLLYLCSTSPDTDRPLPKNPKPKKTRRRGWRVFPAQAPQRIHVGVRIGATIRGTNTGQHDQDSTDGDSHHGGRRKSPIPHVRSAHWHLYWKTGARDGDRTPVIHWVAPVLVAPDRGKMDSVIRKVKK